MPTTTPFANLITFSRGSNATVVGPNGLVQWAPSNIHTFSEQFDNAAWTKNATTVTANSTAAPNATLTADTLTASVGTGVIPRVADTSLTTVNGAVHTASIYVRAGTYTFFQIYLNNQAADWANFTLTGAGTATANGSCTAAIQALSDGWYRVSITYTAGGTDRRPFYMLAASATATRAQAWNPNGSEAVLLWGAQLELGTAATTYNPTTVKNLLGFSEAFDNAAWTKTRASIVPGAAANPINGLFNAQKLMEDTTASNSHFTQQTVTLPSTPQTISAYVRSAGRDFRINLSDNTTGNAACTFNLSAGTAGAVSLSGSWSIGSASITSLGSGWYRVALTATRGAGTQTVVNFELINSGSTSYTGDGNSGVFIYGAQLSDSASLDPYVPTPGAAPSSTAYYGPRFDYDPVTRAARGILIEEQRTNLLTYSEQFDNAVWTKANATISANATTAPDGTNTADKLQVADTSNVQKNVNQLAGATTTTYTDTVYAKAAELTWLIINQYDGADRRTWFNLSNGTVGTTAAGATATITNVGNGWYRCSATRTTGAGSIAVVINASNADGVAAFVGNVGDGIFIWGAQREAGAFATSYIPTIASTVTRSADVATITGQNFGQFYRQDEGCLVLSASVLGSPGASTVSFAQLSNGSSNNFEISLGMFDLSAPSFQVVNSTTQANLDLGSMTAGQIVNMAGAYKVNDFAGVLNGGTVQTDTSGSIPSGINTLGVGFRLGGVYINGHIRSIRYIPVRAADFQLQALTT